MRPLLLLLVFTLLLFLSQTDAGKGRRNKGGKKRRNNDQNGSCPFLGEEKAGVCTTECQSDNDCNGKRKCCFTGCANVCVKPAFPVGKPGYCPTMKKPATCITRATNSCEQDYDCGIYNDQKCCSDGCVKKCMDQPACKDQKSWKSTIQLKVNGKKKTCKNCNCNDMMMMGDPFLIAACEENKEGIRKGCCFSCQLMNIPPL